MLGSATMFTAIILPALQRGNWPYLNELFTDVLQGNADYAFLLADAYNGRNADGTYERQLDRGVHRDQLSRLRVDEHAARCAQRRPSWRSCPGVRRRRCRTAAPPARLAVPRRRASGTAITAQGSAPILVVGTTNDPATPYEWAETLAAAARERPPRHLQRRGPHGVQQVELVRERRGRRLLRRRHSAGGGPRLLAWPLSCKIARRAIIVVWQ